MGDLGINVSDKTGIKDTLGDGDNFIHFNAIGVFYVNPETEEIQIVKWKYIDKDKKPTVLWKGKKAKIEYELELK